MKECKFSITGSDGVKLQFPMLRLLSVCALCFALGYIEGMLR